MLCAEERWPHRASDPVPTIAGHLRQGEDVVRCAAARALGALSDERAAPALTEALLDEDPDVRADAMAALVTCARPSDADTIRRSLMGDPVREVKVSAVQALVRLDDRASVPLLRALAKDRCSADIVWDEVDGPWDDWLDVQFAAILALGDMGAADAVDDLLEARADELGQDLDLAVFGALAKMPAGGIEALLGFVENGTPRERVRSIAALSQAAPDLLAPMIDDLVEDGDPDVRGLAIPALDGDSPHVARLVLEDPEASIRCAALAAFAPVRGDLLGPALHDDSEEVRAVALEAIAAQHLSLDVEDLAANVVAWMQTGGARLAVACVCALPELLGADAQPVLCELARNPERPEDARLAAVRALGHGVTEQSFATLNACVGDRIRQVRLAALSSLIEIVKSGPASLGDKARDVLFEAMRGSLVTPDVSGQAAAGAELSDVGASKVEEAGSGRIAITPEGVIVPAEEAGQPAQYEGETEDGPQDGAFPTSTLEAIQASPTVLSESGEAPLTQDDLDRLVESRPKSRRKRVAVDGPDDIAGDVRIIAIRTAAACPGREIDEVLVEIADTAAPGVRPAVFETAAIRSELMPIDETLRAKLIEALGDPDALVRGAAARAVANGLPDDAKLLVPLLEDADPMIRATVLPAVGSLRPGAVAAGLNDPASVVRRSAMDHIVRTGTETELEQGLRACLQESRTDCLMEACKHSARARDILASALAAQDMTWSQTQSALEAIAVTAPGAA